MVSKAAQAAAAQQRSSTASQQAVAWKNATATLEKVAAFAATKIDSMEANSHFLTKDRLDVIPKFVVEELTMGRVLGKGGFGTVNEIRSIKCDASGHNPAASSFVHDEDAKEQESQDRKFIASHCIRDGGDARYCIKVGCMHDPRRIISLIDTSPFFRSNS